MRKLALLASTAVLATSSSAIAAAATYPQTKAFVFWGVVGAIAGVVLGWQVDKLPAASLFGFVGAVLGIALVIMFG